MWEDQLYDGKNSFLTQRNIFEVQASNKNRLKLEIDQNFKNEMNKAISNLERNPTVKNKVWNQLSDFHQQLENDKGLKGLLAGQQAKKRLLSKERTEAEEEEKKIDQMVLDTSKTSALRAINLN